MALAEAATYDVYGAAPAPLRPSLTLIQGGAAEGCVDVAETSSTPDSLLLLDRFFLTRELAEAIPGVRGEMQDAVRADVERWFVETFPDIAAGKPGTVEDYTVATNADSSMLGRLLAYLQDNHEGMISGPELYASQDFLNATFALNRDAQEGVDLSQNSESHAFVVPVRLSTAHPEYSDEIRPLVHAFQYVPDRLIPSFLRDLPPFIADRYVDGGYVTVAPVTDDMKVDLLGSSTSDFMNTARARVNGAIRLAEALGARQIGLGATFPGLMRLGEAAASKDTTTGHGGTTALMVMLINKLSRDIMPSGKPLRIGVLGLGQIGLPTAQVVADFFPNSRVNVFDSKEEAMKRFLGSVDDVTRFDPAVDVASLIEGSDIILSTATTTFNFTDPNGADYIALKGKPGRELEGKAFIDDSEPRSIKSEEVLALGGVALDVTGRDYSGRIVRSTNFGYGGTLAHGSRDAFGCELEVAVLSQDRSDLVEAGVSPHFIGRVIAASALRRPVTAADTRNWISKFEEREIGPAPYQVFGRQYEVVRPSLLKRVTRKILTLGLKQFPKAELKLAA